jgi:acetylornithine deacetylase/succinyl-diaminopimelate desuccinylase-like protein
LKQLAHSRPGVADRNSAVVHAASAALQAVWAKRPIESRTGGTIPIVALIQEILHSDSIIVGFGLPDDNLHAPNEKIHLPTFHRGVEAFIHFLSQYAE